MKHFKCNKCGALIDVEEPLTLYLPTPLDCIKDGCDGALVEVVK